MLNYILKNPIPHQSFYKKYASKKYMKVGVPFPSFVDAVC